MRLRTFLFVTLCLASFSLAAQEYQLSKPLIKLIDGGFFDKKTEVSLDFRLEDASLYYTLDGSEPTKQSQRYKKPIRVNKSSTLKVKAFKPGFSPSETVTRQLQKLGLTIKSITLSPGPSDAYPGHGSNTLIDRKAGSMNFRDGKWLGYNKGTVTVLLDMGKAKKVKEVMLSTFSAASAWIMPPASVTFLTSADGKNFTEAERLNLAAPQENDASGKAYYNTHLSGIKCRYLKLVIEPLNSLPDWHPGKGTPGWLFMDEIIIR